jgi:hypothetical protein
MRNSYSARQAASPAASTAKMSSLILKRGSASRPPGQWRDDDYDVLENGGVVARIFFLDAVGPLDRPWMWASGRNGDLRRAAHGTSRRARPQWRHSLWQREEHLEDTENNFE